MKPNLPNEAFAAKLQLNAGLRTLQSFVAMQPQAHHEGGEENTAAKQHFPSHCNEHVVLQFAIVCSCTAALAHACHEHA